MVEHRQRTTIIEEVHRRLPNTHLVMHGSSSIPQELQDIINQYGGAIAYGHPLASSGVRLMTQLARQFEEQPEVRYGLTTMCVGLGMGGTLILENPHHTGGDTQ